MRSNLHPRQLLVLMDFTSAQLEDKPGGSATVQDCIIVMEYIDLDGTRIRRNMDFICASDTNKHDYHFVLQVWVWLFLYEHFLSRFDSIDVWSDGGPHHFKTRYCQWMMHSLSFLRFDKQRITHHFFASYHGHSLADGHAAVIKRALHAKYQSSEHDRHLHRSSATWGPATIEEVKEILEENCKDTTVIIFKDIDREDNIKKQVKAIKHIKRMHSMTYFQGVCWGSDVTNDSQRIEFSF
jgi:hypothetical protein